jgi:hypothetical protein
MVTHFMSIIISIRVTAKVAYLVRHVVLDEVSAKLDARLPPLQHWSVVPA